MKVFVTGATGFVGSAVVRELLANQHQVIGLTRSTEGAAKLERLGVTPHHGSLEDVASLARGAAMADAVIHTAFNHDFTRYVQSCAEERRVVAAMGEALAGSQRLLLVTGALGTMPRGAVSTEEMRVAEGPGANPRVATEEALAAVAARGVRVGVVRLPPSVHGDGDPHFVATLIKIARGKAASAYVGEGANRWPAVHRLDAARLFRLVVEKCPQGGTFHAVAEEGIAFRAIATAIGEHLGVPVKALSPDEAAGHFAGFAHFAQMDTPASSELTQKRTGWSPRHPGLLADLEQGSYFTP